MRKHLLNLSALFSLSVLLNSCTVIGGIFKAGVWTGIFVVVAIIILIVIIISRMNK